VEQYDTVRMRKDGTRISVSLTASPIHDESGEIVGVSTQARDISSTRRALDHAEQHLRGAFRDAPIGMCVFTLEDGAFGRVQQANPEMTRLLGYGQDEIAALSPGDLTHPDDAAGEAALLDDLVSGRRTSYGIEKRNRHKDGRWIWVWVTVSALEGDRAPRAALAHMLDITERKRGEGELELTRANLERSNAELDQFAYVASHDLKEPLILLSAYARMLEDRHGEALDDEGLTFLGHVRDEAARMKSMIDDLLDYSRLETRADEASAVDLGEALDTALRTLAARIEESGARVDVRGQLPVVDGSPSQFERLLRNLVANAIKFRASAAPAVELWADRGGDEWIVCVQDNGIGIDPAKANRVFDVFQRLHSQDRYEGTGMGLAICKRVVERHGGRIWVEPAADGGSVFKFTVRA
jgi:PAS domain S-box-containing protein